MTRNPFFANRPPVRQLFTGLAYLLVLFSTLQSAQAEFDHGSWDQLLTDHVREFDGGQATAVDYGGMQASRSELRAYLERLAAAPREEFERWTIDEQLAFLINAYNAWTVELILGDYPDVDSIRDIGFLPGAAWRRDIVRLFGEQVSLDELEHEMIRGWDRYQEPRIHFAVNCAAIGCPALRIEAYSGAVLESQLEDSSRLFLSDRDRNYADGNTLYVSRIFDWYEEDFERGWNGVDSVGEFLLNYAEALGLSESQTTALRRGDMRIRYLDYDWGLNGTD